jgi:hypothetical protein
VWLDPDIVPEVVPIIGDVLVQPIDQPMSEYPVAPPGPPSEWKRLPSFDQLVQFDDPAIGEAVLPLSAAE